MRVVVIGAGEVGFYIAQRLSEEGQDVVVIDRNERALQRVAEALDVMTLLGNGGSARVLEQAGIKQATMLIAVTQTDEANVIACMLAKKFGVAKTVARVRGDDFGDRDNLLSNEELGIDLTINPERVVAREIIKLLKTPAATEVDYFANNKVEMLGFRVHQEAEIVGKKVRELPLSRDCLIVAIARNGDVIIPRGDDEIIAHDTIFVLGKAGSLAGIGWWVGQKKEHIRSVAIVGGGRISLQVAEMLQDYAKFGIHATLIEEDERRCHEVAEALGNVLVIHGNGTDLGLLKQEGIGSMDAFIAATRNDEVNILAGVLGKHLGVKKSIVKVSRPDYGPVVEALGIDAAIHPRLLTANTILKLVRKGNVVSTAILKEGKAEVIEFKAIPQSPIVNRRLEDVSFPRGTIVGAIVRGNRIIIPRGQDAILPGDRAIVFTLPDAVASVERQFAAAR